jgi:hypothetical protein
MGTSQIFHFPFKFDLRNPKLQGMFFQNIAPNDHTLCDYSLATIWPKENPEFNETIFSI